MQLPKLAIYVLICILSAWTQLSAAEPNSSAKKKIIGKTVPYEKLVFLPGRNWARSGDFEFVYEMKKGPEDSLFKMHGEMTVKFRGKTLGILNAEQEYSLLHSTYAADLDGNGKKDYVIPAGSLDRDGAPARDSVIILMQFESGKLQQYDLKTPAYFPEDFVDLNSDGKIEIVCRTWYPLDEFRQSLVFFVYRFEGQDLILSQESLPEDSGLPDLSQLGGDTLRKVLARIQEKVAPIPLDS